MVFDNLGAGSSLVDEFDRGAEEVVKEPPFMAVEFVEERHKSVVIKPIIPQPLSYMSPVFLFDVGVIVFVIGPASGKTDGVLSMREVAVEVVIEEL